MFNPIKKPNLPDTRIKCAVIGDYPQIESALNGLKIETVKLSKCCHLTAPVCRHADMLCCHLGATKILLERSQIDAAEKLNEFGFAPEFIDLSTDVKNHYPFDVLLNAAFAGDNLIANTGTVSDIILKYAIQNGYRIINVKQGYTKCSVCVVNEEAIITDDTTIKSACDENGFDALLVEKGSVKLDGHAYGFIGGCTGLIDKDCLAFCGDIDRHSDAHKIKDFLKKHGVRPLSLFDGDLIDVGGILPIAEGK